MQIITKERANVSLIQLEFSHGQHIDDTSLQSDSSIKHTTSNPCKQSRKNHASQYQKLLKDLGGQK